MKQNLENSVNRCYANEISSSVNLELKEAISKLKAEKNLPHKTISALAGMTGILSILDEKFGDESDWDTHLSIKNDIFGQYVYWKPVSIYNALTKEYRQRIRPRIKKHVPTATERIDLILEDLMDAMEYSKDKPVFPDEFNATLRRVFIESYYDFIERFKLFLHKKIPELH